MSVRNRVLATAGVTALVAAPFALASGAATAIPAEPTVTDLGNGISEIAYTNAGDYTFTAPAGVTKVSALLVGGGAGGGVQGDASAFIGYAGGGGGVVYVDSVDVSAPITFTVGAGGAIDAYGGQDTILGTNTAGGGGALVSQSGSPQDNSGTTVYSSYPFIYGSGGGAGGVGGNDCSSGPGLTASEASNGSALFPALLGEPEYGVGGSCAGIVLETQLPTPGKGGNIYTDVNSAPQADAGSDGAVILRWKTVLADTGMNVQPWMVGTGVAAVAAGLLFASNMLRARRKGRHSA